MIAERTRPRYARLLSVVLLIGACGGTSTTETTAAATGPTASPSTTATTCSDENPPIVESSELAVLPKTVGPGQPAVLLSETTEGSESTGVSVSWQCWDGSDWVTTHQLLRRAGDIAATAAPITATVSVPTIGVGLPGGHLITVPDVSPGRYRIVDDETGGITSVAVDQSAQTNSQSSEDAVRDGVVLEVAALPVSERVTSLFSESTEEGEWVASRLRTSNLSKYESLGEKSGRLGVDYISTDRYAYYEILLMDSNRETILRSFPMLSITPAQLVVTENAVYCLAQGDDTVAYAMLCRIDRTTLEAVVRVFPQRPGGAYLDTWNIEPIANRDRFRQIRFEGDALVVEGDGGVTTVDPNTLELLG